MTLGRRFAGLAGLLGSSIAALVLHGAPASAESSAFWPAGGAPYSPPPPPELGGAQSQTKHPREGARRIGHISLLAGEASSFSESTPSSGWLGARPDMPISARSSLSTAPGARAEVRIGTIGVSLDGDSQADFLAMTDDGLVVRVARGRIAVTVAAVDPHEPVELVARGTRLLVRRAGVYRLEVDAPDDRIVAQVLEGQADFGFGETNLPLLTGQETRLDGAGPPSQHRIRGQADAFERWVTDRRNNWHTQAKEQQSAPGTPSDVAALPAPTGSTASAPVPLPQAEAQDAPEPSIPPPAIQYYAPIVPYFYTVRPAPGSDPRLLLPGQTQRSILPPLGQPRPGPGIAHPPRVYPTPPRLYPTPPREYPTPSRDWPQ